MGEGCSWMYKGVYYSFLYTRAGMYRGNHIHADDQHTLLLEGKRKYIFREDGKNGDYHLIEGEVLDVPAGQPHIFLPEEDCLTVEWWDGDFEAEEFYFPEYTIGIKKKIVEFNKRVEELKKAKCKP